MVKRHRHRWIDIRPGRTWYRVCDLCWKQETLKLSPKEAKKLLEASE